MRRLFLLAGIWGWSFLFIKVAVAGMPPAAVSFTRVALGLAVLLAVVRLKGLRLPRGREAWRHFAVVGLFGSALPFTLLPWGEQHISSAAAAVLNASTTLFSALLAAAFLGHRLSRAQSLGLLFGFVGVGVAAGLGAADLSGSSLAGEAAAVGAGASYAIGIVYARRHLGALSPLVAAAGQLAMATVLALPVAMVTTAREGLDLTPRRVLAVCLLGVLGTGLAYVLFYRVIADLGPTMAAAVTYLAPVMAVTVGLLFLHEAFHLRLLAGGALIVGGIVLLNGQGVRPRDGSRRSPTEPGMTYDAAAWGVQPGYHDAMGQWRDSPSETIDAILRTMGVSAECPEPTADHEPVLFVRPGASRAVGGPSILRTEDGAEIRVDHHLPPDLPLGYHVLTRLDDGSSTTVVVSPGRCPLPTGDPTWGWAVQLYAMRSAASWGMGDLADLRQLASWSASELGAGMVLVNPLHAAAPGFPQAASPYFPSSRRFRNPLYLRVEDVPGARTALGDRLDQLAADGRALNRERLINRDAVWRLKLAALQLVWDVFPGDAGFDRWREAEGAPLDAYATFCTLVERHGGDWRAWPEGFRHPDRPEVAAFGREHRARVRFHQWLQWLLDLQLESASTVGVAVMHDLAVGVDPGGADVWLWQDVFALDMAVGAPPDEFNTRGQDWGLPPFDPWRLRAAGYGPFVETIRAGLVHAGGLRVDHVMGLFRLFWIPRGEPAAAGAYVRYPSAELLDIVALEAHRAGAYVVGEDLGTVEDHVRHEMAARDLLSYKLLWFEDRPPREYPERALAAVTTHDLPTVAGLWTGSDLEHQHRLGMEPNVESTYAMCRRLGDMTGVAADAPPDEVVAHMYTALGTAPCLLLTAALDDAVAVPERPNMPGTVDEWPNWSIALPMPLEELMADPRPRVVARALDRRPQPDAS